MDWRARLSLSSLGKNASILWPGLLLSLLVAGAGAYMAQLYQAPIMLLVLLVGLAASSVADGPALQPGIDFSGRFILRLGVGLLGIQLGLENASALGGGSIMALLGMVVLTILFGLVVARLFRVGKSFGILSGGAVAICGASAALAFSAVLPKSKELERHTALVVVVVTLLSTLALVAYPVFLLALDWGDLQIAYVLGASIHDVAQVVGAGLSVNDEVGVLATLTKMLRVASLPLMVFVTGLVFRAPGQSPFSVPWFLVMFVALAVVRNTVPIPEAAIAVLQDASRWLLVTAIAAIGLKTNLKALLTTEPRLMAIIVIETIFLLALAMGYAAIAL